MSFPPPTTLDTSNRSRILNLGAGPSSLPTSVLLQSAQDLLDYKGTGIGLCELSHRSGTFKQILDSAESDLRSLLSIPEDYAVLFTQGGGTEQFSATALNLLAYDAARHGRAPGTLDYAVTGSWSSKAIKEGERMGGRVKAVTDSKKRDGKFGRIAPIEEWELSPASECAMLYYCDNETVDGVEFPSPGLPIHQLPDDYRKNVPIVADCSSNILSRPIDVAAHSLIFFGAQKNVGPPGVTILIARKSLLARHPDESIPFGGPRIPTTLVYKNLADNSSLYNTPPMFSIHVSGLVFRHLIEQGGVKGAEQRSSEKAQLVYSTIDESKGFYEGTTSATSRSRMNVTFRIKGGDDGLEGKFVEFCKERGIEQVKGHRSVGGIRASLYNAISVDDAKRLVEAMREFCGQHSG